MVSSTLSPVSNVIDVFTTGVAMYGVSNTTCALLSPAFIRAYPPVSLLNSGGTANSLVLPNDTSLENVVVFEKNASPLN